MVQRSIAVCDSSILILSRMMASSVFTHSAKVAAMTEIFLLPFSMFRTAFPQIVMATPCVRVTLQGIWIRPVQNRYHIARSIFLVILLYQNNPKISTDRNQPEPSLPLPLQKPPEPWILFQLRVLLEDLYRLVSSRFQQVGIADDVGCAQVGKSGLAGAEELAGSAHAQVLFSDLEAVIRTRKGIKTLPGFFGKHAWPHENAV